MVKNSAYTKSPDVSSIPAVHYSAIGPRDTFTSQSPSGHAPQQGEERIYHVLEAEEKVGKGEEERVYNVLEGAAGAERPSQGAAMYEVPLERKGKGRCDGPGKLEMAYSSLQHH